MDIADFAHGIFRGFAEGEISDYDSVEILDQKVIQKWNHRADFLSKEKLYYGVLLKKYFYMEKGYLCEKRCPFFVPGYRYADKGEGGKNHEKRTLWENAAFIRGSVYAYDGVWNKGKQ